MRQRISSNSNIEGGLIIPSFGLRRFYNLDCRSETCWPDDHTVKVLSTVKGEARGRFVRFCVANQNESMLKDPLTETSLSKAPWTSPIPLRFRH